jgi:hypothetical protein
VPDVPPPVVLNLSLPPRASVIVFVPPRVTCLTATTEPSAGAVGNVTVTLPLVVSTGTKSPTEAV